MKYQSFIILCVFFLQIVSGTVLDCLSYSTCLLKNITEVEAYGTTMHKVTFLTIIDTDFTQINDTEFLLEQFTHTKTLKIHNSTFKTDSFIRDIIKYQTHIKVLDLSQNRGIKTITKETFGSTDGDNERYYLFTLNLSNNEIEEVAKGALTLFESLEELDLSGNSIKSLKHSFSDNVLLNLKSLDLSNNQLYDIMDEAFKGLHNLEKLIMNKNLLKNLSSSILKPLKNLKELDVSENQLMLIEVLSPKLKILNVEGNFLKSDRIRGLNRLTNLKTLKISRNPFGNINNETFMRLISLETLKMESLLELQITHEDVFQALKNLKYLDLRNNGLSDIEQFSLHNLSKLILVQLDKNRLSTINLSHLPLESLRYIGLQGNFFKCDFLENFLTQIRDKNIRLYFENDSLSPGSKTVQGIECQSADDDISPTKSIPCNNEDIDNFYTWHTKLSSFVCLSLAAFYIWILWRNKEAIRKIKDEEYEQEELLHDDFCSSSSFNLDDLLAKEKSREISNEM
ncbi:P-granule-associated novel protein 1-like [Culicoides brevitarsis]|uniref:P-granule-associated novel protein 1-like n=1 Tax=Culicoides brevitarsis TaxID=469753 RepID=UPI00307C51FD